MGAVHELVVLRRRASVGLDQGPGAVEEVDAEPSMRVAVKCFQRNLVHVFPPFLSLQRVRAPSPDRVMVVWAALLDLESRAECARLSLSPRLKEHQRFLVWFDISAR